MGSDDRREKDKRDKRDGDRDKKEKRDRDDKDRDRKDKDRKRDRSHERKDEDKDRKDKSSRRTEDRDTDKERRRDKSKDRERDRSRGRDEKRGKDREKEKSSRDKKEKVSSSLSALPSALLAVPEAHTADKEKERRKKEKEKLSKNLDSVFGEKFSAQSASSPLYGNAVYPSHHESDPSTGKAISHSDTFTINPIAITIGGKRVDLPKTSVFGSDSKVADGPEGVTSTAVALLAPGSDPNSQFMSQETIRACRENRRMHVTGFPRLTPKEIIQSVVEERFAIYRREIIAKHSDKEVEELPEDAEVTVDRIVEIFLENQKEKPFAFIELNTDDMVEMFIDPFNINKRPINVALTDGTNASLNFGRPRDFKMITAVNPTRVLIQGIHPRFDADKMKQLVVKMAGGTTTSAASPTTNNTASSTTVESATGDEDVPKPIVQDFAMKDGIAFVDFEEEETAHRVIKALNGITIAKRLMAAQPLSEVMRALCISTLGFKIPFKTLPEDSDTAAAKKEENDSVLMELLKITSLLPQTMCKLHTYMPHLRPLMGAVVPVVPTRILVLYNIVDDTDLESDAGYSKLCENIAAEVERYGRVEHLIIPRHEPPPPPMFVRKEIEKPKNASALAFDPAMAAALGISSMPQVTTPEDILYQAAVLEQDEKEQAYEKAKREYPRKREEWERSKDHLIYGNTGKIFVVFATAREALNAQQGISGKLYCNRTVVTSFLFEDILYPPQATQISEEQLAKIREFKLQQQQQQQQQADQTAAPADNAESTENENQPIPPSERADEGDVDDID